MNLVETEKLLTIIRASYDLNRDFDPATFDIQVRMWADVFANTTYEEVTTAFRQWFATQKFQPKPSELKELIAKAKNPEKFYTPDHAWEMVGIAVRKFGWTNQPKAKETLPASVWRTIQAMGGWLKLCQTPSPREWDLQRLNFIQIFGDFEGHTQQEYLLNPDVMKRLREFRNQEKLDESKEGAAL